MLQNALLSESEKTEQMKRVEDLITDREMTFLQLVCDKEEYTYERISELMNVSRRTVDGYRESLFSKFSIKSKIGLVLFAIKYGLVKVE
jgi:DNA-binding CsgD family transcriptional regulator